MAVVNAAINYCHANSSAVVAGIPSCTGADGHIRGVIQPVHGMVDAYRKNLWVSFEIRQSIDRNREGDAVDHVKTMVQPCAQAMDSSFLLPLGNLLVLYDNPHSFSSLRAMVRPRRNWRKVVSKFAMLL